MHIAVNSFYKIAQLQQVTMAFCCSSSWIISSCTMISPNVGLRSGFLCQQSCRSLPSSSRLPSGKLEISHTQSDLTTIFDWKILISNSFDDNDILDEKQYSIFLNQLTFWLVQGTQSKRDTVVNLHMLVCQPIFPHLLPYLMVLLGTSINHVNRWAAFQKVLVV